MILDNTPCVLIIDDDQSIQKYIQDTLTDEGYRVVSAPDGAAAMDMVALYRPQLILLDMYMPTVDGWSFLATYPQSPQPHAPIIAMSSDVDVRKMKGVAAGLAKPFTIDRLMLTVKGILPLPMGDATASKEALSDE